MVARSSGMVSQQASATAGTRDGLVPAGRTGFSVRIWVARSEANTLLGVPGLRGLSRSAWLPLTPGTRPLPGGGGLGLPVLMFKYLGSHRGETAVSRVVCASGQTSAFWAG